MTFSDQLRAAAARRRLKLPAPGHPEPLVHLEYDDELRLKADALTAFWSEHRLPGQPRNPIAAPRPRGYRTTSKRRVHLQRGRVSLAFAADDDPQAGLAASSLDAAEHVAVYAFLQEQLGKPVSSGFAAALNYVIARGAGSALAVIFNLRAFDGPLVRRAKQLGEALQRAELGVRSAFLYLDPTGSDYNLESKRPAGMLTEKKLFGPEALEIKVDGRRLRFPPTVFSQVNEAMLSMMTESARELLRPLGGHAILDLYCGYGLFSACLGGEAGESLGVDAEGPAIEAARKNAKHLSLSRARFLAGRITGEWLAARVRRPTLPELALLDPPRQGTAPGVIEAVASRGPERVLHIFCGTEELPRELEAWSRGSYRMDRAVPLDLFPGTANLETFVLLRR